MSTQTPQATRKAVEQAYAEAINASTSSCCQPSCCTPAQSSIARKIGYSPDQLSSVPIEAATRSFGCGNPLAFAEVKPGQTVLDLGSGPGLDLLLAAQAVGSSGRVIGVDMTDEMIEAARANISRAGVTNVEVRKGIIEELPVEDASVDWVISNCVINLSPEKARVFAEIFRVLAPGGTMQVSDVVVDDLPQWAKDSRQLLTACVAGAISEQDYLQGIKDAGLEAAEVIERVVVDDAQIRSFLAADERFAGRLDELSPSLSGKVASVKIKAHKLL